MGTFVFIVFSLFLQNYVFAVTWPTPRQTFTLEDPKPVDKYLDCNYDRYVPNVKNGKWGSGEYQLPVFNLASGATIERCIYSGVDGIHCNGPCKVNDCWNEDIGEDSISLFGTDSSANFYINGGGARNGNGKAVQFDGAGTLHVDNFYIGNNYLGIRSCGNCLQQYSRTMYVNRLTVENLEAGQFIVGVNNNTNFKDKAYLTNIHILGSSADQVYPCKVFDGNNNGGNPRVLTQEKTKGDGKYCIFEETDIHINS